MFEEGSSKRLPFCSFWHPNIWICFDLRVSRFGFLVRRWKTPPWFPPNSAVIWLKTERTRRIAQSF